MQGNPAIILHAPQLGENIGAAARVMLNFGLTDLRLVSPRDGWPSAAAEAMSAGALGQGVSVTVFDTLEAAMTGLTYTVATTARPRGMEKEVFGAAEAVGALKARQGQVAVLFGGEKSGLPNEAVALCDAILTYPVNPAFSSLNLAQAVGVFCHQWGASAGLEGKFGGKGEGVDAPATRENLIGMFEHFEAELERAGYFYPPEKTPVMITNLRNALVRAQWTEQEVRTFRGAIKALSLGRGKARVVREE
ncbi:tRNA/rRNA methyltransferase SpoU [Hyphomonas polymorpha PS728]|uniref:tRNA/rRNA methyltransferase SpoU n=1 Tax=Hyphomonas polymorpha PS728 TaxID=1280954 RepID=A0A062VH13_9PROT|nr:TrmH family RNA methyltransferase [Hyphomonas polymorpha]KCZ97291.1 tRNA/rRNA methyltransferase SpoU [Hyphomonas polymorpha PS728]